MKIPILTVLLLSISGVYAQYFQPAKTLTDKSLLKEYFLQHNSLGDDVLKQIKNDVVVVQLTVDESGKTSNYSLVKSISSEADREAIRLAENLIWLPAKKNGNPTKDRQTLEVHFHYKQLRRLQNKGFATPNKNPEYPKSLSQNIYSFADLTTAPMPVLKNDMTLEAYLLSKLNYPSEAYNRNISGTVSLDFVVETNGLASNIIVHESVGGGCDQEAVRLLQSIQWIPATVADSLVRSSNNLKVVFSLGEKRMQNIPNRQGTNL